jgi:hypothetical protein
MSRRRRVGFLALSALLCGCKESQVSPGDELEFNPREMIHVPAGAFAVFVKVVASCLRQHDLLVQSA